MNNIDRHAFQLLEKTLNRKDFNYLHERKHDRSSDEFGIACILISFSIFLGYGISPEDHSTFRLATILFAITLLAFGSHLTWSENYLRFFGISALITIFTVYIFVSSQISVIISTTGSIDPVLDVIVGVMVGVVIMMLSLIPLILKPKI